MMAKRPLAKNRNIRLVASEPVPKAYLAPLTSIDLFCAQAALRRVFRKLAISVCMPTI